MALFLRAGKYFFLFILMICRGNVKNRLEFKLGKTILTRQCTAVCRFCHRCILFISQGKTVVLLVLPHTAPLQVVSTSEHLEYILVAVTSSGILKAKQKLGRTFNSDKLGGIDFTKISKLTMCSA